MILTSSVSKPSLTRLMAFVDGGYLRTEYKRKYNLELIDFTKLKNRLESEFNANCGGKYNGDLVRVYYYDAIVEPTNSHYNEQQEFFSRIRSVNGYHVQLGKLTPTGKNGTGSLKQKGVDVQLAVDMITKAYQDQYDFAILLAGDGDFVNVVNAVKDSGKRVFGMYFREHISDDLYDLLDARIEIDNFGNDLKAVAI